MGIKHFHTYVLGIMRMANTRCVDKRFIDVYKK